MPESVDPDYVRAIMAYDSESGVLTWKKRPGSEHQTKVWNSRFAGKSAGSVNADGYIEIGVLLPSGERLRTYAHRVAWAMVTGKWPEHLVDHRDGDKSNNRFSNLRHATYAENAWNTGARAWSKSGIKGVSWDASRDKWQASIFVRRKEEAAAAYAEAAARHHGAFAKIR